MFAFLARVIARSCVDDVSTRAQFRGSLPLMGNRPVATARIGILRGRMPLAGQIMDLVDGFGPKSIPYDFQIVSFGRGIDM